MQIRRLDRAHLTRAYGLDSERLLPWPVLNAPFEGAWCVLRPGDVSSPHSHHEEEIFIALTGAATLVVDGERQDFVAGDIAHLPIGTTHQVVNESDDDFEYYGVWWDAPMATTFLDRLDEQSRAAAS